MRAVQGRAPGYCPARLRSCEQEQACTQAWPSSYCILRSVRISDSDWRVDGESQPDSLKVPPEEGEAR